MTMQAAPTVEEIKAMLIAAVQQQIDATTALYVHPQDLRKCLVSFECASASEHTTGYSFAYAKEDGMMGTTHDIAQAGKFTAYDARVYARDFKVHNGHGRMQAKVIPVNVYKRLKLAELAAYMEELKATL